MDKLVYVGSILAILLLILGSAFFPESSAMWLASTSVSMDIARGAMALLMGVLLFTDPPRRKSLRGVLGSAAVIFVGFAFARLLSGTDEIIDGLIFLLSGVAFGIAAAERVPQPSLVLPRQQRIQRPSERGLYVDPARQSGLTPRAKLALAVQQSALLMTVVVSGALYQNLKPYRAIWRGG